MTATELSAEPATATATATASAAAPKARLRLLEWFWRGQSLAQARQASQGLDPHQRERMQRARAALELGDRTLDPVDELKAGRGTPLACSLYREAAYWALLAQDGAQSAADLNGAFAAIPRQLQLDAAGGDTALAEVEAAARKTSLETWQDPEEAQTADARKLQGFVKALLRLRSEPEQKLARLLLQRALRTLGLVAVLAAPIGVAAFFLFRAPPGPDLAAGKPWKASSALAPCHPKEHECAGVRTDIFFCTQEEKNPWLEIDLGNVTEFSRVEVQNRTDCCDERAIPLVIEVSTDGTKWKEVARKTEIFSLWKADFKKVKARYVRTRTLARTFLHLERVSVRRE